MRKIHLTFDNKNWKTACGIKVTSGWVANVGGFSIAGNRCKRCEAHLSQLDGWADQPDSNAKLLSVDWELDEVSEA